MIICIDPKKDDWHWYAHQYNCNLAEAIADRDFPARRDELVKIFTSSAGRAPTEEEIYIMRPNNEATMKEQAWFDRENY